VLATPRRRLEIFFCSILILIQLLIVCLPGYSLLGIKMQVKKSLRLAMGAVLLLVASSSALAELCTAGRKTEVLWKGEWYKATITEANLDKCKITYTGYSKDDDEWVGAERLKIKVLWKGEWYPAKVVKKDGANFLVSYDGYGSDDNEIVPLSRIRVR